MLRDTLQRKKLTTMTFSDKLDMRSSAYMRRADLVTHLGYHGSVLPLQK